MRHGAVQASQIVGCECPLGTYFSLVRQAPWRQISGIGGQRTAVLVGPALWGRGDNARYWHLGVQGPYSSYCVTMLISYDCVARTDRLDGGTVSRRIGCVTRPAFHCVKHGVVNKRVGEYAPFRSVQLRDGLSLGVND
jgi:hypothetical protein